MKEGRELALFRYKYICMQVEHKHTCEMEGRTLPLVLTMGDSSFSRKNERSDRDCGNLIGKDREQLFVLPTVVLFGAILFSHRTHPFLTMQRGDPGNLRNRV